MNRSVNQNSSSLRPGSTNPREEKRRRIRLEKRNAQLIQLWRFVIYSSITFGLGLLITRNGWSPINAEQIYVHGNTKLRANSIIEASGLNFPIGILAINPKELEINLMKELPVENISIRRNIITPSIEIGLQKRNLIAFADRRGPKRTEKGMLDKDGNWIPLRIAQKIDQPNTGVYVNGWISAHQSWIAEILEQRNTLGSSLQKIIINPNGELILQTKDFEKVQLGANKMNFREQIKALNQLSKKLPEDFINQKGTILDIRDPFKPELQMPKPD